MSMDSRSCYLGDSVFGKWHVCRMDNVHQLKRLVVPGSTCLGLYFNLHVLFQAFPVSFGVLSNFFV